MSIGLEDHLSHFHKRRLGNIFRQTTVIQDQVGGIHGAHLETIYQDLKTGQITLLYTGYCSSMIHARTLKRILYNIRQVGKR